MRSSRLGVVGEVKVSHLRLVLSPHYLMGAAYITADVPKRRASPGKFPAASTPCHSTLTSTPASLSSVPFQGRCRPQSFPERQVHENKDAASRRNGVII